MHWTLSERIKELTSLFRHLEKTSSRNLKMHAIDAFRNGMGTMASKDLDYCLEILDGRWKTGYTFLKTSWNYKGDSSVNAQANEGISLEEFLRPIMNPKSRKEADIIVLCRKYAGFQDFIEPLINRKWRLGIGKSLLGVKEASPMLGKKYDSAKIPPSKDGYYITEKLDGNRCIAQWVEEQERWVFTSRSGKEMRVQFNMQGMPKEYIYDGEILSRAQRGNPGQANFNALSGAVNSKYGNKSDLLYSIFDIILPGVAYASRRSKLEKIRTTLLHPTGCCCAQVPDVWILPILQYCSDVRSLEHAIPLLLEKIVGMGGEGLMINIGSRNYEQKRTDAILKVKAVQTMDMEVVGLVEGTGKHEGLVGSLICVCEGYGKTYECKVGSGLSDEQRARWAENPDEIMFKIVEVAYFSTSQDQANRGSTHYSLRFPRFKRVREDKKETSEH